MVMRGSMKFKRSTSHVFSEENVVKQYIKLGCIQAVANDFDKRREEVRLILLDAKDSGLYAKCLEATPRRTAGLAGGAL